MYAKKLKQLHVGLHYRSSSRMRILVAYFPTGISWDWEWTRCSAETGIGNVKWEE